MEDICNFIPPKNYKSDIDFIHFVYETNIRKQSMPITRSNYCMNLVYKGTALLKSDDTEITLKRGDLFFTFPYQSFTIDADNDFTLLYISFSGDGVESLLNNFNITKENCIFQNFNNLIAFWMDTIRRINRNNANVLTESVLMYTLSFISDNNSGISDNVQDKFDTILEYINHNYTSKDMSIKKVADIFFYSEKYFSSLFIKKTGIKFSQYLNNLRINYATELIKKGTDNISVVSSRCGYSDQFYFSKVFKKITGKAPSEYKKFSILPE